MLPSLELYTPGERAEVTEAAMAMLRPPGFKAFLDANPSLLGVGTATDLMERGIWPMGPTRHALERAAAHAPDGGSVVWLGCADMHGQSDFFKPTRRCQLIGIDVHVQAEGVLAYDGTGRFPVRDPVNVVVAPCVFRNIQVARDLFISSLCALTSGGVLIISDAEGGAGTAIMNYLLAACQNSPPGIASVEEVVVGDARTRLLEFTRTDATEEALRANLPEPVSRLVPYMDSKGAVHGHARCFTTTTILKCPGVYMAVAAPRGGSAVEYIGSSLNVGLRLQQHASGGRSCAPSLHRVCMSGGVFLNDASGPLVTFTQLDKCPVAKLLGHDGPYTVEETSFVVRVVEAHAITFAMGSAMQYGLDNGNVTLSTMSVRPSSVGNSGTSMAKRMRERAADLRKQAACLSLLPERARLLEHEARICDKLALENDRVAKGKGMGAPEAARLRAAAAAERDAGREDEALRLEARARDNDRVAKGKGMGAPEAARLRAAAAAERDAGREDEALRLEARARDNDRMAEARRNGRAAWVKRKAEAGEPFVICDSCDKKVFAGPKGNGRHWCSNGKERRVRHLFKAIKHG